MGYKYYNPNPLGLSVGDCTIRAISKVIERDWKQTYLCLIVQGYKMYDMPSANRVLMKIDKLEMEKEEPMEMKGYSQRSMGRYYVDGTYGGQRDPWGYGDYSYAQGGRGMDSGNSYHYPMVYPMYDNRYSRTGEDKEEMKREMMKLMESTNDEKMRKSILEVMNKM